MLALVVLVNGSGCGTIAPKIEESHVASFSGNEQNSGIIDVTQSGAIITPGAYLQYNSLIKFYGHLTVPKTTDGFGSEKLTDGNYRITLEALSIWKQLAIIADREDIKRAASFWSKFK